MGVKKKKKNQKKGSLSRKDKLIIFSFGLILISVSIGIMSFTSSKITEEKVYSLNNQVGKVGTPFQGLSLKFKKEDVSCSGLVSFDCEIKNPSVYVPLYKKDMFKIEKINLHNLSKNGIILGKAENIKIDFKNISMAKGYLEGETKEAKNIQNEIFPINISTEFNIHKQSKIEGLLYGKMELISKSIDINIEGKILNVLESNVQEANKSIPSTTMVSIPKDIKISIKNKNIENLYYDIYLYYYNNVAKTKEEKQKINNQFLRINKDNLIEFKEAKSQIMKNLDILLSENDKNSYFSIIKSFLENKNEVISIEINNNSNVYFQKLDINSLKYLNIKIKKGVLLNDK